MTPFGGTGRLRGGLAGLVTAAAVALTGCTTDGDSRPSDPHSAHSADGGPAAGSSTTTSTATGPAGPQLPDTAVGRQIDWVLQVLAAGSGPDEAAIEEHFSAEFRAQTEGQLPVVFDQLRTQGPYVVHAVEATDTTAVLELDAEGGGPVLMQIAVDGQGQISMLLFQPDTVRGREQAASWEELEQQLDAVGGRTHLIAARIEGGACVPVAEMSADEPAPLGSVFKLYVLGAVVDAVEGGDLAWQDTLTVTDGLRSLPSGELQDVPEGTEVTVLEAATGMVSISDNTATDLLIDAVGRDAVEQAVADMGAADPQILQPFPTTRELFLLGWGAPGVRAQWAEADTENRRRLLEELPQGLGGVDPAAVTTPVWPDGVGWFATARDVCAAHVALQERAGTQAGQPVRDILGQNPGIEVDPGRWPYVGFKGGSAPGVFAGSWYLEDGEGQGRVLVVQTADAAAAVDGRLVLALSGDAVGLMAQE